MPPCVKTQKDAAGRLFKRDNLTESAKNSIIKPYTAGAGALAVLSGRFFPDPHGEGVVHMVTYEALFAYTVVLIGIIDLVYRISKRK